MKNTIYRVPYKHGDTIKIKPFFDVHLGNAYCDKQAFIKYLADSDKNTHFMGGGDLLDSIIVTDPRFEKHADATEKTAILDEQVDMAVNLLWPYRDRIIGIGRGNHENEVIRRHGTDLAWRVCEKLDCEYLGYSGFITLRLRTKSGGGRTIKIKWHHGWGGGARTQGADLTKYSHDTKHWEADIFLYGHVHKKQMDKIQRSGVVGTRHISKPQHIAICGTFLKTYADGYDSTYSEVKGYPPVSIGGITISIKPVKSWVEIDIS